MKARAMPQPLKTYRVTLTEENVYHIPIAAYDEDDAIEKAMELYDTEGDALCSRFEIDIKRGGIDWDAELLHAEEGIL